MLGTKTHIGKKSRFLWSFFAAAILLQTLFMPLQVRAAGAVDTMDLDQQVNAYTYYYAWAKCLDNTDKWDGGHTWISTDDAVRGKWFSTATGAGEEDGHVGYIASTSKGIMDCNGTDIVNKALSTWGFGSDKLALLTGHSPDKGFGFTRDSDGNYQPPSNYRSTFLAAIRYKAFGNKTPTMSPAAKYLFYKTSFVNGCKATALSASDSGARQAADSGKSDKYGKIATDRSSTGTITYTYYALGGDTTMTTAIDVVEGTNEVANVLGGAYGDGTAQCRSLMNDANKNIIAYAAYKANNPDDSSGKGLDSASSGESSASSCAIDSIGWIVCPVLNFMAKVVDQTYRVVASLLTVQPLSTNTSTSGLYSAWTIMRNIANIAFVIAFMFIIYSQLTGMGVSNYGVKKLLPKLIIAAILVNLSYWICAIAVDLSNILGVGMKSIFDSLGASLQAPEFDSFTTGQGGGWEGIVGAIIGAGLVGASLYLGVGSLLVALPAVLLSVITVFLVLTLRQAIIIILIVVSPLAFVAYLLPNTEDWFKKWRTTFQTMLLMYPIIALIFGGSAFASKIIMNSATDETGDGLMFVQIMGALVAIIPLAITPIVMKTAGGVLNRFAGIVNNPNRGPFDALRKRAQGTADAIKNRRDVRALRTNPNGTYRRRLSLRRGGIRTDQRHQNYKRERDAMAQSFAVTDGGLRSSERAAGMAEETASQLKQINANELKVDHLNENHGLHTRATQSGLNLHNQEEIHKNDATAAYMTANGTQYDRVKESRGDLKNTELAAEQRFESSGVGRVQANTRQAVEGELQIAHEDNKDAYKSSTAGIDQSVRAAAAQQRSTVTQRQAERAALGQNRDINLEAQAAQDQLDAAKAEEAALVQELRTDEGAAARGAQFATIADQLQKADLQKRVQTQRAASAANVGNLEYGEKIREEGSTFTDVDGSVKPIAETAGGIDTHGATKAKGAAVQAEIQDYQKTLGAIKALNSKTENEAILGDPAAGTASILDGSRFDDASTEEVAALTGLVASRKHRASQIRLQKQLYDQQKRIDAMPPSPKKDELQDKLRNVIQQVHADRSGAPFGVGDQERGANEVGKIGVGDKDIFESTRERILTNVSAGSLAQMDPDDMKLLFQMARDGKLGPKQLDKVKSEYDAWKKSNQYKDLLQDKHRVLLEPFETGDFSTGPSTNFYDLSGMGTAGAE